jgi:hypothetical protein
MPGTGSASFEREMPDSFYALAFFLRKTSSLLYRRSGTQTKASQGLGQMSDMTLVYMEGRIPSGVRQRC